MDPVEAFVAAAREYCHFVEHRDEETTWFYARECLRLILRLYDRATFLPDVMPEP